MAETVKKTTSKSTFETLNSINVSDKTEKKNGLTYLSWAWAWGEVKKRYPETTYSVIKTESGCIYHTDGRTAWVEVEVTLDGMTQREILPIMDYRNNSIILDKVTSMDAVRAIQRAVTKCIGRFGLGLYIYAGEDLPEEMSQKQLEGQEGANKRESEVCVMCKKPIVDSGAYTAKMIIEESMKKLGKPVCLECWKKGAEKARAQKAKEEAKREAKLDGEYQALLHEDAGDRV